MNKKRDLREIISNLRIAMFDIDGTLVNSIPRHIPTRKQFIKEMIKKDLLTNRNPDECYKIIEISLFNFWEKCINKNKMSCSETIDQFGKMYLSQKIPTPSFKEAIETIKFLKNKGIFIGAVTSSFPAIAENNTQILQEEWSKKGNKGKIFDEEIMNDKANHPNLPVKPSFEAYKLIIKKINPSLFKKPTFYMGDGRSDLEFAENIQKKGIDCPFIYIHSGKPKDEISSRADFSFDSIESFFRAITKN